MKATILTSVFAVLVSVTNLNAKNVKVYSNVESNEEGAKKEMVMLDSKTSAPVSQNVYVYDANGNIVEKTVNKWSDEKGWAAAGKYEYVYNEQGKVANLTYTKWNNKSDDWARESQLFVHVYDDNNELIAVNEVKVSDADNFITQK